MQTMLWFVGILSLLMCLAGCEATNPADTAACLLPATPPASPFLRLLLHSEAPGPDPQALVDDSLTAQILALHVLAVDSAITPALRRQAVLRFLRQVAETPQLSAEDESAIERFFAEILDETDVASASEFEPLLRGFRHALSRHDLPSLQIRATVRLAAWLWQKSCPVAGSDGACIERRDVWPACVAAQQALLQATRRRFPNQRVDLVDRCSHGPRYSYRVIARNPSMAADAQGLVQRALGEAARLRLRPQDPQDPLTDALAHAQFLRLEPHFEARLSQRHWSGSPGRIDPLQPIYVLPPQPRTERRIYARMEHWLRQRYGSTEVYSLLDEELYSAVFDAPETHWAAAAHSRVGQLLIDLETQIVGCRGILVTAPPPGTPRSAKWPQASRESFLDCGGSPEARLTDAAVSHLRTCRRLIDQEGGATDEVTEFCRESLPSLAISEWADTLREIRPLPSDHAPSLDIAPPYSSR